MAKHIIEFDLKDAKDERSLKRNIKALDMVCALQEISEQLRASTKYYGNVHDTELLELFQGKFYNILEDYGINLEELLD
jgi:hypothetical protein